MQGFSITRQRLIDALDGLSEVFSGVSAIPSVSGKPFEKSMADLKVMRRQMSEEVLRVAVVGSIKSGKSTFVNAFFGADFLRRGAGVVTSIVTRIRKGDALSAVLYFKSLGEVNDELSQAMNLFPVGGWQPEGGRPDIRRERDRAELKKALARLDQDSLITGGTRSTEAVLISSFVAGWDRVQNFLGENASTHVFEGDNFAAHKLFVGDENLAVFLKDVCVTLPSPFLEDQVEMADCQGSDSPNPLHLTMIEDYLLKTQVIVYVVSSRTGLRRADIRFLTLLSRMGLCDNIFFVINVDFSEHENLDSLYALLNKTASEIALIKPSPAVFAFSALYRLFGLVEESLSEKDRARLGQWRADTELSAFSEEEAGRFESAFRDRLTRDRAALLLQSHAQRLSFNIANASQWVKIHRDLLSRDKASAADYLAQIQQEGVLMEKAGSMIRQTISGAMAGARNEVANDVDRFFDPRYSRVMTDTWAFVDSHTPDVLKQGLPREEDLTPGRAGSISPVLYAAFADLKNAVDRHMAENVNPSLVGFVREEEEKIAAVLGRIGQSYQSLVTRTVGRTNAVFADLGISATVENPMPESHVDVARIKQGRSLALPPLSAAMQYAASIRATAVAVHGFGRMLMAIKRAFGIEEPEDGRMTAKVLAKAVARMKRDTKKGLSDRFLDFRENLKFQYFFAIMEAASDALFNDLSDGFRFFAEGMSTTQGLLGETQAIKDQAARDLEAMAQKLAAVDQQVAMVLRSL